MIPLLLPSLSIFFWCVHDCNIMVDSTSQSSIIGTSAMIVRNDISATTIILSLFCIATIAMVGSTGLSIMTGMSTMTVQNDVSATILAIRLFACVHDHSIMIGSTATINKNNMTGLPI